MLSDGRSWVGKVNGIIYQHKSTVCKNTEAMPCSEIIKIHLFLELRIFYPLWNENNFCMWPQIHIQMCWILVLLFLVLEQIVSAFCVKIAMVASKFDWIFMHCLFVLNQVALKVCLEATLVTIEFGLSVNPDNVFP